MALIRLPVPAVGVSGTRRILLELDVASSVADTAAQAHVYGIEDNAWTEASFTWQQAAAFLKSGVPAGSRIEHNVVTGHGGAARMLGQLAADSAEMTRMGIDVTDFARSRSDGVASFLIVQEHRWDVAQPSLENGDIQAAGLRIRSREASSGTPPRLATLVSAHGTTPSAREATVRGGSFANQDVDEVADGFLMVKHGNDLSFSRKSYFQFDLPPGLADPDAPATLTLRFQGSFSHQIQVWSLAGLSTPLDPAMNWNQAPANSTTDNGMLSVGTPAATLQVSSVRVDPGTALNPHLLTFPRLGDLLDGDRVTLVLTGVDSPQNHTGGLRIAAGSVTLDYQVRQQSASPWHDWRVARFGNEAGDPQVAGPLADPDRDGIPNLLEYALGGGPETADHALLPIIRANGQGFEIRFSRNPAATDVILTCQQAATPAGPWSDVARSSAGGVIQALVEGVGIAENHGTGSMLEVVIQVLMPTAAAGFYRLRAVVDGG
jgi:hypothetical protein